MNNCCQLGDCGIDTIDVSGRHALVLTFKDSIKQKNLCQSDLVSYSNLD